MQVQFEQLNIGRQTNARRQRQSHTRALQQANDDYDELVLSGLNMQVCVHVSVSVCEYVCVCVRVCVYEFLCVCCVYVLFMLCIVYVVRCMCVVCVYCVWCM